MNIVFSSDTGFTEKYANMLGKKIGASVCSLKNAKKEVPTGGDIIYLGNVMADMVSGLEKARKDYNVKVVCAVGISLPNEEVFARIKDKNHIDSKLFVMQGGFNLPKLGFVKRNMIKMMVNSTKKKENPSEDDKKFVEAAESGADFVKEENLSPVVEWVNANLQLAKL